MELENMFLEREENDTQNEMGLGIALGAAWSQP